MTSMPQTANLRIINQWVIFVAISLTVFAIAVNSNDSTLFKPYFLVLGAAVIISVSFFSLLRHPTFHYTINTHHVALALYWIASALSLSKAADLHRGLENLLYLTCFLIFTVTSLHNFDRESERNRLHIFFIVVTVLACSVAVAQDNGFLPFMNYGLGQTTSTFGNTNYFAGFLVMMLPLTATYMLLQKHRSLKQIMTAIVSLIIIVFLIKTKSRSAWVGASISLIVLFWFNFKIKHMRWVLLGLISAGIIIAGLIFPDEVGQRIGSLFDPDTPSSFARRLYFYTGAARAFFDSPLLGNGIGNFILFLPRYRSPEYWMVKAEDIVPHAHNEYLEILSETGVIGFVAFVVILFFLARSIVQNLKSIDDGRRTIFIGYGAAIAGILVDNLTSPNLRIIPIALIFWTISGVVLSSSPSKRITFTISLPSVVRGFRFILPVLLASLLFLYSSEVLERYRGEQYFLEGSVMRWENNTSEASEKFRNALNERPSHSEARLYLAANLLQTSNFREAKNHIDTVLGFFPDYPKARLISAIAMFELRDTINALNEIEREFRLETSPQTMFSATELAQKSHQIEKAYRYTLQLLSQSIKAGSSEYVFEELHLTRTLRKKMFCKEEFIDVLRQLQYKFPLNTGILTEVALSFIQCARYDEAMKIISHLKTSATYDNTLNERIKEIERAIQTQDPAFHNYR